MQSSLLPKMRGTVPALIADTKKSDTLLFLSIFVAVAGVTPLLAWGGATIGLQYLLGILVALAAAVIAVRWPLTGLYMVAGCVVLVEQAPIATPDFTDHLYIFYWPSSLTGLPERPIGFFMLLILLALIIQRLMKRQRVLSGGGLLWPFVGFLLCVVWGIIHGLQTGGDYKIIILEVRPFWYFFISYLLAYNLITEKRQIRALFWIIIVGAGVKGLQGTYIYLFVLHGNLEGTNEIMAHEESYFFVAVILLLLLFLLHYRYRPQKRAIQIILPVVILALVANERRTDYLALLIGIGVSLGLIFIIKPQVRKRLVVLVVCILIFGAGYVIAFGQASGALGEPARAIISVVNPSSTNARDASSDLYRVYEDADLQYTVKQDPILGWGFGKPFLQPQILPNILSLDPYYLYIPHNTIYWVWMRLGDIGYLMLWFLFGAAIVRGSLIARKLRDPYLQVVAMFVVAATVMEIIVAYADYQLYFFRNVLYLGLLLGVLMRLPAIDEAEDVGKEPPAHEALDRVRAAAAPKVGSQRA